MKLVIASVAGVVSLLALGSMAEAKPHRYVGVHVINADDGMCYIEAPHIHGYTPYKASVLFRNRDGRNHFIGDPVAYGYDGPKHSYHGHHPIISGSSEDFCYLDGAHFHAHAPAPGASFEVKGDIHWYVGPLGPRYKKHLHKRKRVNAIYADIHYPRPVVVVTPPAAYVGVVVGHGAHVDVGGPDVRGGVTAEVDVLLPAFSLEIGGHGHHKHKHHKVKHHKVKHHKVKRHKVKHSKHRRHKRSKRSKRSKRGRRWAF